MNCDLTCTILHGYFDGELSVPSAAEFEHHLQYCSNCVAQLDACSSVRDSLLRAQLYEHAPVLLRQKIREDLRSFLPTRIPSPRLQWRWLAAALVLATFVAWRIIPSHRKEEDYQTEFAAGIVDAHLRSLLAGQITNVNSSDAQTVRAWFGGKVKFAFPIRDFADHGFSLQGGRVDVVQGRTVATLVYSSKEHPINVFIWPTREPDASSRAGSRQGYQWIDWRKDRLEFCTVSDASSAELEQIQRLLAE